MTTIDWEAVKRRVERAAHPPEPDADRLAARRSALARPAPAPGPAAGEALELVVFRLGGERFAIPAGCVLEALPLGAPTPVPGDHPWLLGVLAHRGGVLGVLDLRHALLPAGAPRGALTRMVAVAVGGLTFGIAAEEVEETRRMSESELGAPPPGPFRGITGEPLIVLDLEALAADGRLRIDDGE